MQKTGPEAVAIVRERRTRSRWAVLALRAASGAILTIGAALAACGVAAAQDGWSASGTASRVNRADWEQRMLRDSNSGVVQTAVTSPTSQRWAPYRRPSMTRVAQAVPSDAEEVPAPVEASKGRIRPTPESTDDIQYQTPSMTAEPFEPEEMGYDGNYSDGGCDGCGGPCGGCGDDCGDEYGEYCNPGTIVDGLRNFTFFAGVQGFKGPVDVGQNGNFGFGEGLNFGAPLGDPWHFGFQLGLEAVQTNLSGFSTEGGDRNGRDQIFFTGGVFRRALDGGLQNGVVFDYVHDNYYAKADLKQVRSETSLRLGRYSEIGYWGAYAVSRDRFQMDNGTLTMFRPTDIFAGFYRRHFTGGGQGRIWAGATGMCEAVIGADATVPLGTSWALGTNFTYLIPKERGVFGGQERESWSVAFQLVWYPGRQAKCVESEPYQPLLPVADNTSFLYHRAGTVGR
jgi:hypothetical protein